MSGGGLIFAELLGLADRLETRTALPGAHDPVMITSASAQQLHLVVPEVAAANAEGLHVPHVVELFCLLLLYLLLSKVHRPG